MLTQMIPYLPVSDKVSNTANVILMSTPYEGDLEKMINMAIHRSVFGTSENPANVLDLDYSSSLFPTNAPKQNSYLTIKENYNTQLNRKHMLSLLLEEQETIDPIRRFTIILHVTKVTKF